MSANCWEEHDITYSIGIYEAYRGREGLYSGGHPDRGWVWERKQSRPRTKEDCGLLHDERITDQTPLLASPSVFETITDATDDVERVLRILEPDTG